MVRVQENLIHRIRNIEEVGDCVSLLQGCHYSDNLTTYPKLMPM